MRNTIIFIVSLFSLLQFARETHANSIMISSTLFIISGLAAGCSMLWISHHILKGANGYFSHAYYCVKKLPIPRSATLVFFVILFLHIIHIFLNVTTYPISTVEMFRQGVKNTRHNDLYHRFKYYHYNDENLPVVINMRKEHIYFFSDYLGWRWNSEFTYSAAYDVSSMKPFYELLLSELASQHNIKKLHVGLHEVNYNTRQVTLYTEASDIAQVFPSSISLYVPERQKELR
jgi:hypothetical protein